MDTELLNKTKVLLEATQFLIVQLNCGRRSAIGYMQFNPVNLIQEEQLLKFTSRTDGLGILSKAFQEPITHKILTKR